MKNKISQNYVGEKILERSNIIQPELLDSLIALESQYSMKKNEVLGKCALVLRTRFSVKVSVLILSLSHLYVNFLNLINQ